MKLFEMIICLSRKKAVLCLLLFTLSLAVLFATRSAQQERDSLAYAQAVKLGEDLLHPHHLLFNPISRAVLLAAWTVSIPWDAVTAMQVHNIIWAAAAVAGFFLVVCGVIGRPLLAFLASLILLATQGFWLLATQTTLYTPACAVLILLSAAALHCVSGQMPWRGYPYLLAFLLALAVLYYQANVLFCLPLAVLLVSHQGRTGFWKWTLVVAIAGIVTLAVYLSAFNAAHPQASLAEFWQFCFQYNSQLCWGAECVDAPENWGTFANYGPQGIFELGRGLLWLFVPHVSTLAVLASGIGLIGLLWWHISGLTHASQRWKMRAFLVTWVLTYLAFFLWWLPSYQHPLLIVLPPILLLGILTVVDISLATPRLSEKRMRLVVSSALMLLAVTNMYVAVRPRLSPSDSYWEAKELSEAAPGNARFLVSYRVWNHLRYYFDRQESARLAKFPLVYFYQDKQLPATYHLDDNSLVFIDSGFVAPGYRLEGYSSQPVNGFVRPDRWLAYISWLFGFESDSGGRIARARDFRVVRLREGNPYLLLLQEKKSVDNVSDFMRELETTLTSSGNERVLATWRGDAMTTPGE